MALESVLQELVTQQMRLRESFVQLRLTVAEDHPARDPVVLVDQFEYAIDDNLGWQEEALTAAVEALEAARGAVDLEVVRVSLGASNQAHMMLARLFRDELSSHRRINELLQFGRRRGGEWLAWTEGVKAALDQQNPALDQVADSFISCWLGLAEQRGRNSISVHATNAGQQITVRPARVQLEH